MENLQKHLQLSTEGGLSLMRDSVTLAKEAAAASGRGEPPRTNHFERFTVLRTNRTNHRERMFLSAVERTVQLISAYLGLFDVYGMSVGCFRGNTSVGPDVSSLLSDVGGSSRLQKCEWRARSVRTAPVWVMDQSTLETT